MEEIGILNFFFELGQLRRIRHEGWTLAGVEDPESVAAHSLRAAQIGFVLASLEGYDNPFEVCTMLVFHDLGESRIGDIHRVANRYITADEGRATAEALSKIGSIGNNILTLWQQVEDVKTKAGIIAKDADLLEQALMAKEYMEKGYNAAHDWIRNISTMLRTCSAKALIASLKEVNSYDWWKGLKDHSAKKT